MQILIHVPGPFPLSAMILVRLCLIFTPTENITCLMPEAEGGQREQRERLTQHNGGLPKRKVSGFASGARADSSGPEAENSDD